MCGHTHQGRDSGHRERLLPRPRAGYFPGNIVPWVVQHGAESMSRHARGENGRTAWERRNGRVFKHKCLPFGEVLLSLPAGAASRLEPRWRQGIWLGIATKNGENNIFDTAGGHYVQARSVKRIPREDRDMTAYQ